MASLPEFGLVGSFAGDAAKHDAVAVVARRTLAGEAVAPSEIARIMSILPYAGRIDFVVRCIMPSPARDTLVQSLYDWCFTTEDDVDVQSASEEDTDFVMIGCGTMTSMNVDRYFVLKALIPVIPMCGPLGVAIFKHYEQSTSTVFRVQFLTAMVKNEHYSNAELLESFRNCVEADRKAILAEVKGRAARLGFVDAVVAEKLAPQSLQLWGTTEALKAKVGTDAWNAVVAEGYVNFPAHREVLLDVLRGRMAATNDLLERGRIFEAFEAKIVGRVCHATVVGLLDICEKLTPLRVEQKTRAPYSLWTTIERFLAQKAMRGELDPECVDVTTIAPSDAMLRNITGRVSFVKSHARVVPGEGVVFDPPAVCSRLVSFIRWRRMKLHQRKDLQALVVAAFENVRARDFYAHVMEMRKSGNEVLRGAEHGLQVCLSYIRQGGSFAKTIRDYRVLMPLLDAVTAMYLRNPPSALSAEEVRELEVDPDTVWCEWASKCLASFEGAFAAIDNRMSKAAGSCSQTRSRTAITSHFGAFGILLGMYHKFWTEASALAAAAGHPLCAQQYMTKIAKRCDAACSLGASRMKDWWAGSQVQGVVEGIVRDVLLQRLSNAFVFDVVHKDYLSEPALQLFKLFTDSFATDDVLVAGSPAYRSSVLTLAVDMLKANVLTDDQRKLGFVEGVRDGKRVIIVIDAAKQARFANDCEAVVRRFLARGDDLVGTAWAAVRAHCYPEYPQVDAQRLHDFVKDVATMKDVPAIVRAEVPVVKLAMAAKDVKPVRTFGNFAASLKSLGIGAEVVAAIPDLSEAERVKLLRQCCNVSNPAVYDAADAETKSSDMHARMAAIVSLLRLAEAADLHTYATTLQKISTRVTNEAGIVRQDLYQAVHRYAKRFLERSIDAVAETGADVARVEESVAMVTGAWVKMLRDDVSKRDTVAKNTFKRLGAGVLNAALTYRPQRLCVGVRRTFARCGVKLDWIVAETTQGTKAFKTQKLALNDQLGTHGWITEAALLDVLVPALQGEVRDDFVHALPRAVFEDPRAFIDDDTHARLTPADAVAIAIEAVEAAKKDARDSGVTLPSLSIPYTDVVPGTEGDAGMERMLGLLAFCDSRWAEVPQLCAFVDAITTDVGRLAGGATSGFTCSADAKQAAARGVTLLKALQTQATGPVVFRLLDSLVFAAAAAGALVKDPSTLVSDWLEMVPEVGVFTRLEGLPRPQQQLVRHYVDVIHKHTKGPALTAQRAARTISAVCRVLQATPSAIYHPQIRSHIVSRRDDILAQFVGKERAALQGVFAPKHDFDGDEAAAKAYLKERFFLCATDVGTFTGEVAMMESRIAIQEGLSRDKSAAARSDAIGRYVRSPMVGHVGVIRLLEDLRMAGASGTGDSSLDVIVETVVLSVFETDAVWFVLAYLLRPDIIGTIAQRTTASILKKISLHAPKSSVVSVISVLLQPKRRHVIKVMLHKSIVSTLIDIDTPGATALLHSEWTARTANKMHDSVRALFVAAAVQTFTTNHSGPLERPFAWTILDDLAVDTSANVEHIMSLMTVSYVPAVAHKTVLQGHVVTRMLLSDPFEGVEREPGNSASMADQARSMNCASSISNPSDGVRFMEVLTRIAGAHGGWVATFAKNLAFAFRVALQAEAWVEGKCDVALLDELRTELLTHDPSPVPQGETIAQLLGRVQSGDLLPEARCKVRLTAVLYTSYVLMGLHQIADARPHEVLTTIAEASKGAQHLRGTIEAGFTALLATPPSDVMRVKHFQHALQCSRGAFSAWTVNDHEAWIEPVLGKQLEGAMRLWSTKCPVPVVELMRRALRR